MFLESYKPIKSCRYPTSGISLLDQEIISSWKTTPRWFVFIKVVIFNVKKRKLLFLILKEIVSFIKCVTYHNNVTFIGINVFFVDFPVCIFFVHLIL